MTRKTLDQLASWARVFRVMVGSFHSAALGRSSLPGLGRMCCCACQNAAECQDAVTTRKDRYWTRRDVPTKVKPSCYVLLAWVECQTRGCERSFWSGGRPPRSSPKPCRWTTRRLSGGSPEGASRTGATGTR